ncbi:hypothetical protein F5Y09DRAFT_356411 [Xylaria sp. FL1042]|nr:hypothetical protein F5Y09DRAFT_356411 [Xylaria sp. FL1042]
MAYYPGYSPENPYPTEEIVDFFDEQVQFNIGTTALGNRFLNAKCLRFYQIRTDKIAFMLAHPTVERVEFHECTFPLTTLIPSTNFAGPSSVVKEIHLNETAIGYWGFQELLSSLPQLRKLVYFRPSDESYTDIDEIGDVLVSQGQSLEYLLMRNDSNNPFNSWVGTLASLGNLKTLEIELEFLIGFRDIPAGNFYEYLDGPFAGDEEQDFDEIHESFGDWALVDLLPTSLEKLILHLEAPKIGAYYNTYERYGAKFEELILDHTRFDKLEYIQAPCLYLVAVRMADRLGNWLLEGSDILRRVPIAALTLGDDPFLDAHGLPNGVSPTSVSSTESICSNQTMDDQEEDMAM